MPCRWLWHGKPQKPSRLSKEYRHSPFLLFNGIEEPVRATEQIHFLPHIHRPNVLNLVIIDLRFNLLVKVRDRGFHISINGCVGYLAHLFLKEAVLTLVLQAILNLSS